MFFWLIFLLDLLHLWHSVYVYVFVCEVVCVCVGRLGELAGALAGRGGSGVLYVPLMSFLGQARLWGKLISKQATERRPMLPLALPADLSLPFSSTLFSSHRTVEANGRCLVSMEDVFVLFCLDVGVTVGLLYNFKITCIL